MESGGGPESPRPEVPEAPAGPKAPSSPAYGGPVPPGGWDQPRPLPGWAGSPLASWGSRAGAWLIDVLVLLVPILGLFFLLVAGAVGISGDDEFSWAAALVGLILWVVLVGVVTLLYAPVLMARRGPRNGQTLGKQAVGIRVVPNGGEPMTFWPAAVREVLIKGLAVGVASSIIPFIPWFLDNFWPLWDDENRALHDLGASTHVVRA
jgi:uncharacterized RDD family membrane protein YckC